MKAKNLYNKYERVNPFLWYGWEDKVKSSDDFYICDPVPKGLEQHSYKLNWRILPLTEHKSWIESVDKSTKKHDSLIEQLEKFAHNRNYQEFSTLIEELDLSNCQPNEIIKIVDFCLSLDMIDKAFGITPKAKELYPEDNKLENAHKALSPPKVIGTRPAKAKNIEKSQQWFNENALNYKDKWVAVNDGKLIAVAVSLEELKTKIRKKYMNPSTLVEKVF